MPLFCRSEVCPQWSWVSAQSFTRLKHSICQSFDLIWGKRPPSKPMGSLGEFSHLQSEAWGGCFPAGCQAAAVVSKYRLPRLPCPVAFFIKWQLSPSRPRQENLSHTPKLFNFFLIEQMRREEMKLYRAKFLSSIEIKLVLIQTTLFV